MKQKLLTVIRYVLLFGIGLLLLWLTFRHENIADIFSRLSKADPFWLILSLVLALMAFVSRAVRWVILMEPLGIKPKLAPTMYSLMIGYFANLAIPRIGEITRCGSLAKAEDLPFNKLIGTVIVERVIDLLMLMFTMMLVAFLEFDVLSGFLSEKVVEPILGKSNGMLGMLLFFGTGIAGIIAFVMILKYGGNSKFVQKLRKITADIIAGLRSVLRMQKNGWFLFK